MCVEDPEYEYHFCVDCGQCFCLSDNCDMCYAFDEYRCATCCNMAMNTLGCYCGRCISDPDLEEHLRTEHGNNFEYHTAVPVVEWSYDEDYHWKDCRFCNADEHKTAGNTHYFNDYMVCEICGYVGEMGPSINGVVNSFGDENTEIVIELFDGSSDEPIKTLTIYGTTATYLIKDIESGTYTLKVTKGGHVVRTYIVTVGDSLTELNIELYETGDANMDGELDILDYQQIVNAALNDDTAVPEYTDSAEDYELALCDFNCDGYIDVIDCALVARLIEDDISAEYDSIEITGVTSPLPNGLPSYKATLDDSRYEIYDEEFGYIYNGVTWYDLTEDTNLDKDDKFISGHSYKVTVEVIPSNNGEWNLKYATINGNTAKVEEADDCYLISYTFTIEEGDAITITDLTEPVAGQLPSYKATLDDSKYKIYDEEFGYIYNGVTWYDLTEDSNIDVDDKFIAGHTYKVTIEVIPRNGEDWKLKYATINDNAALVEEADDCYLVSYVFDVA